MTPKPAGHLTVDMGDDHGAILLLSSLKQLQLMKHI